MKRNYYVRSFVIALIILMAASFYQLPYYVSKPGIAKELSPIITVEDGYDEAGSFMLTTVRMGRANIYAYLSAKFSDYEEIHELEDIRREDETDEEYNVRQLHLMASSKLSAIEVAYKKAGLPVHYDYKGVYVLNVLPSMPADGKLKPADRITELDGNEFASSEEFIKAVSEKQPGDSVILTYERNGNSGEAELILAKLPNSDRAGVGITLVDDKEITVDPEVTIDSKDIGGPSAGFMFSLEIYNQLTEIDYTKGHQIAGTGTIDGEGNIGRIGGIEQKIVAADNAGADIFFAPNENGAADSNYLAAVKVAEDIKTNMKIVPVDTFDDAIAYLEKLKEK